MIVEIGDIVTYEHCDRLFTITGMIISGSDVYYTIVSTVDTCGASLVFEGVNSTFIKKFEDI